MQQRVEEDHDKPALFWDSMPEDKDNPQLAALEAIKAESTPQELADNHRDIGNNRMKMFNRSKNREMLRAAVKDYTDGIQQKCDDHQLNSTLYGNRAQAQLHLGNHRSALEDSQYAILLHKGNLKAYFRGAKAAMAIKQLEECIKLCQQGLAVEPKNEELKNLVKVAQQQIEEITQENLKKANRVSQKQKEVEMLVDKIVKSGYKFTRPFNRSVSQNFKIDQQGNLHFPALLFYPSAGLQDLIEDVQNIDQIQEHILEMFGDEAPPLEWDKKGEFKLENIELYYLTNFDQVLTKEQLTEGLFKQWDIKYNLDNNTEQNKTKKFVPVNMNWTFDQLFKQDDFLIPAIPFFFVLSSEMQNKEQYLNTKYLE